MRRIDGFTRILQDNPQKKRISETIIEDDGKRFSASEYIYGYRKISPRQKNFHENLKSISELIKSKEIPVFFMDKDGYKWRMDKGCISIAFHNNFLEELKDNSEGFVETVTLK